MNAPLPLDGPLLDIADVAALLRISLAATRKAIEADPGELGEALRRCMFSLSPRRRYFRRAEFMAWLNAKAGIIPPVPASGDERGESVHLTVAK